MMVTNNIPRKLFSLDCELEYAGIDHRFLNVVSDPVTHTITISQGTIPMAARKYLAKAVLSAADLSNSVFYHHGNLTTCVYHIDEQRVRVGHSYCSCTDTYDQAVGDAIAYQRARYGKVKETDLLG